MPTEHTPPLNSTPMSDYPHAGLLILPRLRVQNANAISSPMTWGFPSITAFTGLMTAIERRFGADSGVRFQSVGVICHGFEAQVTQGGYTRSFCLTRNPVLQDGSTAAIVEEGRVHLDVTLVFAVRLQGALIDDALRAQRAADIAHLVAGMRIAGGSVMPPLPGTLRQVPQARLVLQASSSELLSKQFQRLRRHWMPGFALVSRDDVLHKRLAQLRVKAETEAIATPTPPTLLDAWLDLSRLNYRATTDEKTQAVEWAPDVRPGWLVPIPVGYAALSELHAPGTVAGARDTAVPFRFVESVYSIGQWISPHRLDNFSQLLWQPEYASDTGLYRCTNSYPATAASDFDNAITELSIIED